MKIVQAGTSGTKTDGNILDGVYSSEADTILPVVLLVPRKMKIVPVGNSRAKTDEDGAYSSKVVLPAGSMYG